MSNTMVIIVVAGLAIAVVLFLRAQKSAAQASASKSAPLSGPSPDPVGSREESRLSKMSAEDRDWEQASLQRNRDNQARAADAAAGPPL
jgi:hypothetical protein